MEKTFQYMRIIKEAALCSFARKVNFLVGYIKQKFPNFSATRSRQKNIFRFYGPDNKLLMGHLRHWENKNEKIQTLRNYVL